MNTLLKLAALACVAASLSACGKTEPVKPDPKAPNHEKMENTKREHPGKRPEGMGGEKGHAGMGGEKDRAGMDHSKMGHEGRGPGKMKGDRGHTTGTIVSISEDGQQVTINHEEIKGVGMGAMTMGFDVMPEVNLSEFLAGDPVALRVKKGAESYQIVQMCNTETDGVECLGPRPERPPH